MVKAILFDSWGTLLENGVFPSPVKQVKRILRINAEFSEFIEKFEKVFMTDKFDDLDKAFRKVAEEFNVNPPDFVYEKLVGLWNKNMLLAKPFDEVNEKLEQLKKDYRLVLVSNTDQFSLEPVIDKFDMRRHFSNFFFSYETGLLKTQPELYDMILKKLKLKKEDVIMVGDSFESDIKGAEAAGVKAVLLDRRDRREYENRITTLDDLDKFLK